MGMSRRMAFVLILLAGAAALTFSPAQHLAGATVVTDYSDVDAAAILEEWIDSKNLSGMGDTSAMVAAANESPSMLYATAYSGLGDSTRSRLYKINLDTQEAELLRLIPFDRVSAMAYNPRDGFLYAIGRPDNPIDNKAVLIRIDPATGKAVKETSIRKNVVDQYYTLYASDMLFAKEGRGFPVRVQDAQEGFFSLRRRGAARQLDKGTSPSGSALARRTNGRKYLRFTNTELQILTKQGYQINTKPLTCEAGGSARATAAVNCNRRIFVVVTNDFGGGSPSTLGELDQAAGKVNTLFELPEHFESLACCPE